MSVWHAVASCLVQRGLITPAAIVDGELSITDLTGDRDTFAARLAAGDGFVVKLGTTPERNAAIGREHDQYQYLMRATHAHLQRYLPHSYGYDTATRALVLQLLPGWRSLLEQQRATGRFSTRTAATVGVALATLHQLGFPAASERGTLPMTPWAMQLHRPTAVVLRSASSVSQRWIALLQRFPELGNELDRLRRDWQIGALIHHDLKWANIIVAPGRQQGVHLIDWELAQPGDPAWDVGSFFSEYLTCWLRSIPAAGIPDGAVSAAQAQVPLARLQPAMRAFWSSYAQSIGWNSTVANADPDAFLQRATRYCAARMLQSGYERLQVEGRASQIDTLLLQVCLNILRQPRGAAAQLLGIPSAAPAQPQAPSGTPNTLVGRS